MPLPQPVLIGNATLYCGDCLDILPHLSGIDAVVSDPPYGIGYAHGGCVRDAFQLSGGRVRPDSRSKFVNKPIIGDDRPFDPSPWLGFENVLLWGANRYCRSIPETGAWLTWDKSLGRGPADSFTDSEIAWCSKKVKRTVFRHLWKGLMASKANEDCNGPNDFRKHHPSMKPIALMRWCIEHFRLNPDSLILDPYMGSGTTDVAAVPMGHRFVGIEIDPGYFDIACKRIEAAQRQGQLAGLDAPRAETAYPTTSNRLAIIL